MRAKKYPAEIFMGFDNSGTLFRVHDLADFCASFSRQKPARYILTPQPPTSPGIVTQKPMCPKSAPVSQEKDINGQKARLKAQQAPREHKPHRGRPRKATETPQEPQSQDEASESPQEQIEPATANHCSYCNAIVPGNEVEIDEGGHRAHSACGYELDNKPLETE